VDEVNVKDIDNIRQMDTELSLRIKSHDADEAIFPLSVRVPVDFSTCVGCVATIAYSSVLAPAPILALSLVCIEPVSVSMTCSVYGAVILGTTPFL
jgi:hypothetical protein